MRMRQRVDIKTNTYVQDSLGSNIPTVSTLATVWARVQPVRGQELQDIGRLIAKQTYLITIRHRTDVTTDNFLIWGDKTLNIRSVSNRDERRAYLVIECEEGVQ